MEINFRPHHFLCALCFKGRGYSPAFVSNFKAIMDVLNAPDGDKTPINIVGHTHSICHPCPNRLNASCLTEEKITVLDQAHARALNISAGETITWEDAKKKIAERLTLQTFHQICGPCEWKEYGICEEVLKDFLN